MKSPFKRIARGQAVVETAVAFTMLIFLTFSIVNLGVLLHTKMIASYAAFMAARSFQVLGDETSASQFIETHDDRNQELKPFLDEMRNSKYPAFFRVAEDIFTCSLPWMTAPEDDVEEKLDLSEPDKVTLDKRCAAGARKYDTLNIGLPSFAPFNPEADLNIDESNPNTGLEVVEGAFAEQGRAPLRYGVLKVAYRTPIVFDLMNFFGGQLHENQVYVPVLLNPGLKVQLKEGDKDGKETFKDSAIKSSGGSAGAASGAGSSSAPIGTGN